DTEPRQPARHPLSRYLARSRHGVADGVGVRRIAAAADPRVAFDAPDWRTAGCAAGPRAGPSPPRRSLGARSRAHCPRTLLVVSARLVGPARAARGRGRMLRCVGVMGIA